MPRHLISDAHEWINEIPSVPIYFPQGGLAFARLWGLANPRFRSQGDRRDKRPAYVSPYVPRREGCRRSEAATLSPRGLG